MKDRGVPQKLKDTTAARKGGGLPAGSEGVIRGMESAAQNGESAGAENETIRHPPGSQPHNIPGRDAIVAGPGWHVP